MKEESNKEEQDSSKKNDEKNLKALKKDVKKLSSLTKKMNKLIKTEEKQIKLFNKLKNGKSGELFENYTSLASSIEQYLIYLKKERAIFEQKRLNIQKKIDKITI